MPVNKSKSRIMHAIWIRHWYLATSLAVSVIFLALVVDGKEVEADELPPRIRPFYEAALASDWETVNRYLAPELRPSGKYLLPPTWFLDFRKTLSWHFLSATKVKAFLCISGMQESDPENRNGYHGLIVRVDLWRVRKDGSLDVVPEDLMAGDVLVSEMKPASAKTSLFNTVEAMMEESKLNDLRQLQVIIQRDKLVEELTKKAQERRASIENSQKKSK